MNELIIWDNNISIEYIEDQSIDIIITDPPYWQNISFNLNWVDFNYDKIKNNDDIIEIKNNFKKKKKLVMTNDTKDDFIKYNWKKQFLEWYRVLKQDSFLFVFWNLESHSFWINNIKEAWFKFKWYIIWNKKSWLGGDLFWTYKNNTEIIAYYSKGKPKIYNPRETNIKELWKSKKRIWNIWDFWPMNWSIEQTWHPTQKPIQIYKKLIEEWTSYWIWNNDIVALDPFAWSWTVFKAATLLNIKSIWLEVDTSYIIPNIFKTKDFYTKKITINKLLIQKKYVNEKWSIK